MAFFVFTVLYLLSLHADAHMRPKIRFLTIHGYTCIELFHGHMTKNINVMTLSCPPCWCSAEIGVCVVDQCLTNSMPSMVAKGTRLYRIPKVRIHNGEYELELSQRRRKGFLAAIGRKDSASLLKARKCSCTSPRVNLRSHCIVSLSQIGCLH